MIVQTGKKFAALLLALALCAGALSGCQKAGNGEEELTGSVQTSGENVSGESGGAESSGQENSSGSTESGASSGEGTDTNSREEYFSDGDRKDVTGETPDAEISLSGSEGSISDATRGSSGSMVTIRSEGVYHVSGSSDGVQIYINDESKNGNIYLILENVSMVNSEPCIYVEKADKVILQLVGNTALTMNGMDYGAVYAEDDLTINGDGSLSVISGNHGIVCENDLKILASAVTVTADGIGLKSEDTVRLSGATISLVSGHDGVQVDSAEGTGFFYMESGRLTITSSYDGIDVGTSEAADYTGHLTVDGGDISIIAGGGISGFELNSSQKGIACEGDIYWNGGSVIVDAFDDAVHTDGSFYIYGGKLSLSTRDDGIHAQNELVVRGGEVAVGPSYEGLEASSISISDGHVSVVASDDGLNAAGGSDTTSEEKWSGASTGNITISGGTVYISADGDGIDSNGSFFMSEGDVFVEGPSSGANGAVDIGDAEGSVASITGGTFLALGTSEMAINFTEGTQCAGLVMLSGSPGDELYAPDGRSYTISKAFSCALYSAPFLEEGAEYTLTCGENTATLNFTETRLYSEIRRR